MKDNDDLMVSLLQQIAQNTGSLGSTEGGDTTEVNIQGQSVTSRVGIIEPTKYTTIETDDLSGVEDGGTVTLQPGETKALVEYRGQPFTILAVGAVDETGVEYELKADSRQTIGGVTNSPLGLVNEPFSFVDQLGGAIPAENRVRYLASLDSDAPGPVELTARLHLEVV